MLMLESGLVLEGDAGVASFPFAEFCARVPMHRANTQTAIGRIADRLNARTCAASYVAVSERYALFRAYG